MTHPGVNTPSALAAILLGVTSISILSRDLNLSTKTTTLGKWIHFKMLGVTSLFFPGILLSRKSPKTLGKQLVFEKNDA